MDSEKIFNNTFSYRTPAVAASEVTNFHMMGILVVTKLMYPTSFIMIQQKLNSNSSSTYFYS